MSDDEKISAVIRGVDSLILSVRADERERCATICERMIVGGRAWTAEQSVAANALRAAAENIRKHP